MARRPQGPDSVSLDRVLQIKAHQYQITGCCLSPDRRLLATVCLGGCLKVMTGGCGSQNGPTILAGSAHEVVLSAWQRLPGAWPGEALPAEDRNWTR